MDAIAGLLDGPRARRPFLLRCTMDPPWALHIRDVAILLGLDHYLFADDPATPPQAIIHPDQRRTTPDGQEIPHQHRTAQRDSIAQRENAA